MKKLLLTLVSLFMVLGSFAQYKYDVHVEMVNANKETIGLLDQHIFTYNRYIDSNIIYFSTNVNYSVEYIKSIFTDFGIDSININKEKTFATQFVEKAGGVNCSSAEMLCSNTSQSGNSSGGGIQELNASNQGCMSTEHQSSWYYLNVQTGGNLTMNISPVNGTDDYDWAIWGPFTSVTAPLNCPPVSAPIRCSWAAGGGNTGMNTTATDNSEGAGGNRWINDLNTSAGQVYILLVDNFSTSSQPYNMSFGGTTVLGCNQIILPVGLLSFSAEKTVKGNLLSWETETEQRANYFTLEWSTNPNSTNWKEVGMVYANGTTDEKHNYQFMHNTPTAGTVNYYRLNLYDLDGKRTMYDEYIHAVDNSINNKNVIHIYNMMGQEVNNQTKGMLIYQFSDGTTEKVYVPE